MPVLSTTRPAEALRQLHRMNTALVRSDIPDLTPRQLAVLTALYLEPGPHTLAKLTDTLKVHKTALWRAVDKLEDRGLLKRTGSTSDKRNVYLVRTRAGTDYMLVMGTRLVNALKTDRGGIA